MKIPGSAEGVTRAANPAGGETGRAAMPRASSLDDASPDRSARADSTAGYRPDRHKTAKGKRNFDKLSKRLRRQVGRAIEDYHMIEQGDRVMVCLSGGKDSHTMLDILLALQARAPVDFEVVAVNMDQKQPGFPGNVLPGYLESRGIAYDIIERDTYSVVKRVIPDGRTMCGLCSRLRRGNLYGHAVRHGFTKIALGHHRDDIIETLFLNLFHGGRLGAMPPKLRSDDGKNIVIRPLAYCAEEDISAYAEQRGFPIIPCTLCGSQDQLQRKQVKAMLSQWKQHPGRVENIFRAICSVSPSQLGDADLFDFDRFTLRGQCRTGNAPADRWVSKDPGRKST